MRRVLTFVFLFLSTVALAGCESSEERAEGHYQNALALIAEGDNDRAIVELRNVFDFNGSHLEARHKLAELLRDHRKNPQGAYGQYLRLAEQYPDDLKSRIALTELAFMGGNWEELERHGAKAAELAPTDPDVEVLTIIRDYRAAIVAEDSARRNEVAAQAADKSQLDPENLLLREVIIDGHLQSGEFSDALEQLDYLTEQRPDQERFWRQRLQVLIQLGDEEGTEEQLFSLIDMFPEDLEHKATLVRYYLSRNRLDDTEAFLRKIANEAPADDMAARTDLIRFILEIRGPDAAQEELANAIRDAEDPALFIALNAGIDFSSGRTDEAIMALEGIIETAEPSEQTDNVKITLAQMLLGTGNEVGARSLVETVLSDDPSHVDALKMNARWLIDSDDADAAISALRLALDREPEDVSALTLMAEAYSRTGSSDLSRDFLSLAVEASNNGPAETVRYVTLLIEEERYLPAEDVLLDALRVAPNNLDLLRSAGSLYLEMEDLGRVQQVVATLQRFEDNPAAQEIAIQLEAQRLNRASGVDEAISYLESIAGGGDSPIETRVMLIRARLATGDTENAKNLAEELLAENPDNPRAKLVVATTFSGTGDLERAETLYREIVSEFPAEAGVWLELSRIKARQGAPADARAIIDEAVEAAPEDPRLMWALASFNEQDGDFDEAIAIYEQLYERDTSSVIVANNLASMLTTYRDDAESLDRAWNIARRFKDTEIPAVQDTYGWIAHRRGDSEEALSYLENAAAAIPGDALIQYHYAEVLNALGRADEALQQYRQVLTVAGAADTRPQIAAARDKIAELEAAPANE